MSRSLFATLLAAGLSWFAVSCVTPASSKPPVAMVGPAHPAGAAVASSSAKPALPPAQAAAPQAVAPQAPTPPVSLAGTSPTIAAVVSPWKDAGIFFYPLTLMAFAFGIAMYKSSGKSA